jgi:hypothetical protein
MRIMSLLLLTVCIQTATAHPTHTSKLAQDVTGLVKDNQGEPVEGASVFIRPGNKGTVTDAAGRFTFTGLRRRAGRFQYDADPRRYFLKR